MHIIGILVYLLCKLVLKRFHLRKQFRFIFVAVWEYIWNISANKNLQCLSNFFNWVSRFPEDSYSFEFEKFLKQMWKVLSIVYKDICDQKDIYWHYFAHFKHIKLSQSIFELFKTSIKNNLYHGLVNQIFGLGFVCDVHVYLCYIFSVMLHLGIIYVFILSCKKSAWNEKISTRC